MDGKWKNKTVNARYQSYKLNSVETMQKLQEDEKMGEEAFWTKRTVLVNAQIWRDKADG